MNRCRTHPGATSTRTAVLIGLFLGSFIPLSQGDPVDAASIAPLQIAPIQIAQAGSFDPPGSDTEDDPLVLRQQPVPDSNAQDALARKFLVTKAVLRCDVADILVTTSCVPGVSPYCFNQDVSLVNRSTRAAATVSYPHPFRNGKEGFVTNLLCLKAASDFYVMVESSNFENCLSCAWWDVFSNQGKYLGSTKGAINDGTFTPKKLPVPLTQLLFNATKTEVIEVSGLHISRPEPDW
jgi:hypothetical protein